ncbi:Phosphatidylinositide phosphatase SAC1 [Phytophthora pseudosyringae]|uniref:Phosphatidylinositide phosphatase SAC1 n=1 Tax=Phytophthora pseudosyringae TaxID=221518 RepID=A0A8T1VDI2_9STRA|nr:Phosphatidylinositide phosphatase SAC1 [Phytophthora pseudosyringae]
MDSNVLFATLRPLALECASEFVGTFVLVFLGTAGIATAAFTGPDSWDLAIEQVAIGWGFAAMLATFIASPGSGAHLNPAVTLAIAVSPHGRSGFPKRKIPAYMLFQLLGATFAALAVYVMFGSAIKRFEDRLGLSRGAPSSSLSAVAFGASFPHPQLVYGKHEEDSSLWNKSDVSALGTVFLEALGTLLFVLVQRVVRQPIQPTGVVAFTSSTSGGGGGGAIHENNDLPPPRMPSTPLAPLYVGAALAALTMVMTPFTQACLNPARDFGPRMVAAIAGWGSVALPGDRADSCWVYLVGPFVGALAGSLLYDVVIHPGLQTRDEAAAAWMRHQQIEGEAILEQLEKSQTLLSVAPGGGFDPLATRGLHHSDFRDSPTPHNYRLSSPGHLHTYAA